MTRLALGRKPLDHEPGPAVLPTDQDRRRFLSLVADARGGEHMPLEGAVVCADINGDVPCKTVFSPLGAACPRCGSSQAISLDVLLGRERYTDSEVAADQERDLAAMGWARA